MKRPVKPIKNAAKAIIIREGAILALRKEDKDGVYYSLPGGGQEKGETLDAALVRECVEEIGTEVEVRRLVFVRDYIGANHEFAKEDSEVHKVEFFFECRVPEIYRPRLGTKPDATQKSVVWLPLEETFDSMLYPRALCEYFAKLDDTSNPVYLGDIN